MFLWKGEFAEEFADAPDCWEEAYDLYLAKQMDDQRRIEQEREIKERKQRRQASKAVEQDQQEEELSAAAKKAQALAAQEASAADAAADLAGQKVEKLVGRDLKTEADFAKLGEDLASFVLMFSSSRHFAPTMITANEKVMSTVTQTEQFNAFLRTIKIAKEAAAKERRTTTTTGKAAGKSLGVRGAADDVRDAGGAANGDDFI